MAPERREVKAKAIEACRTAVRMQPEDRCARFNLGSALLGDGRVTEAVAEYREGVRLGPAIAESHAALGEALAAAGDVPGAVPGFHAAVERRRDWAEGRVRLVELEARDAAATPAR